MEHTDYAKISSNNVKLLLSNNAMSVRQLAEIINISPSTFNDSLKSKKGISVDILIKIADYFNITVNDLCNKNMYDNTLSDPGVASIIDKYNKLDQYGKELIILILDKELERINKNS